MYDSMWRSVSSGWARRSVGGMAANCVEDNVMAEIVRFWDAATARFLSVSLEKDLTK